jgi:hypothetical protein
MAGSTGGMELRRIDKKERRPERRERKINLSLRAHAAVFYSFVRLGICRLRAISAYISHFLVSIIKVTWNFDSFVMQIPTGERRDCDIRRSLVPKFGRNSTAAMLHEA